MHKPLVSIIIPVYNGSNYLKEAIDSALAQTYKNIEVIVVNDGSNDNGATEEIALSYGPKIRYFHKENGGVSSALNFGIKNMKGNWFSWLSHDDLYTEDKIEVALKAMEACKDSVSKLVVVSQCEFVDKDGKKIYHPVKTIKGYVKSTEMLVKIFKNYSINGCSLLIPKNAFDEIGYFNERYRYIQDVDYWVRLALNGYNFIGIGNVCVKSRIHRQQVTATMPHLYYEERRLMGIPLVDQLFNEFKNKEFKYIIEAYLYDCVKKRHEYVSNYIMEKLKSNNMFTLNIWFKVRLYKLLSAWKYGLKRLYYRFIISGAR